MKTLCQGLLDFFGHVMRGNCLENLTMSGKVAGSERQDDKKLKCLDSLCKCYTHDTRSRNRRHKSTLFFWRRFLVRVLCK